jgi:hypothetical protein
MEKDRLVSRKTEKRDEDKELDRHTAVVTAADPVTPDASFTGPLLTIDKHRCGY